MTMSVSRETVGVKQRVSVRCPNPSCARYGREIGAVESVPGFTFTDERYCAKCRTTHRQTITVEAPMR